MRNRVCPYCGCRFNYIGAKRCESCNKRLSKISGFKPLVIVVVIFIIGFALYKGAHNMQLEEQGERANHWYNKMTNSINSFFTIKKPQENQQRASQANETPKAKTPDLSYMVLLPQATYKRGSKYKVRRDEQPVKEITLSAFYIDPAEVTVAEYEECVQKGSCKKPEGEGCLWTDAYKDHPINCVSWQDAQNYCSFKNKKLPSEAQWEYAARGGSEENFYFGNDYLSNSQAMWYKNNSENKLHSVKTTKPNAFGLYDMHGNVNEWTADWYSANAYQSAETADPRGPKEGTLKVLRGGSAFETALNVKSARRFSDAPRNANASYGIRCAFDGDGK